MKKQKQPLPFSGILGLVPGCITGQFSLDLLSQPGVFVQCMNPLTMFDSPACLYPVVKIMCLGIIVSYITFTLFFHSFMVLNVLDLQYVVLIVLSAGDRERIKNRRAY